MAKPSSFILNKEGQNQVKKHLVKKHLGLNPLGKARKMGGYIKRYIRKLQ
jgi:hypothetical protein